LIPLAATLEGPTALTGISIAKSIKPFCDAPPEKVWVDDEPAAPDAWPTELLRAHIKGIAFWPNYRTQVSYLPRSEQIGVFDTSPFTTLTEALRTLEAFDFEILLHRRGVLRRVAGRRLQALGLRPQPHRQRLGLRLPRAWTRPPRVAPLARLRAVAGDPPAQRHHLHPVPRPRAHRPGRGLRAGRPGAQAHGQRRRSGGHIGFHQGAHRSPPLARGSTESSVSGSLRWSSDPETRCAQGDMLCQLRAAPRPQGDPAGHRSHRAHRLRLRRRGRRPRPPPRTLAPRARVLGRRRPRQAPPRPRLPPRPLPTRLGPRPRGPRGHHLDQPPLRSGFKPSRSPCSSSTSSPRRRPSTA
jgi:hypothetical protein